MRVIDGREWRTDCELAPHVFLHSHTNWRACDASTPTDCNISEKKRAGTGIGGAAAKPSEGVGT